MYITKHSNSSSIKIHTSLVCTCQSLNCSTVAWLLICSRYSISFGKFSNFKILWVHSRQCVYDVEQAWTLWFSSCQSVVWWVRSKLSGQNNILDLLLKSSSVQNIMSQVCISVACSSWQTNQILLYKIKSTFLNELMNSLVIGTRILYLAIVIEMVRMFSPTDLDLEKRCPQSKSSGHHKPKTQHILQFKSAIYMCKKNSFA